MRWSFFLYFFLGAFFIALSGFFIGLGEPFSGINMALIYAVGFAIHLQQPKALIAALGAGLASEAFSPLPFGMMTTSIVLTVWLTSVAASRIVVHFSLFSVLALQGLAFVIERTLQYVFQYSWWTFLGFSTPTGRDGYLIVITFILQLLLALLFTSISNRLQRFVGARFFFQR